MRWMVSKVQQRGVDKTQKWISSFVQKTESHRQQILSAWFSYAYHLSRRKMVEFSGSKEFYPRKMSPKIWLYSSHIDCLKHMKPSIDSDSEKTMIWL